MASDINHYVATGRLVKDAEIKTVGANNTTLAKFTIAVNRSYKEGDEWKTEGYFFDVDLWGKQAEYASKFLQKGKLVFVEGEWRQEKWEKDGQTKSRLKIVANSVKQLNTVAKEKNEDAPESTSAANADTDDDLAF